MKGQKTLARAYNRVRGGVPGQMEQDISTRRRIDGQNLRALRRLDFEGGRGRGERIQ